MPLLITFNEELGRTPETATRTSTALACHQICASEYVAGHIDSMRSRYTWYSLVEEVDIRDLTISEWHAYIEDLDHSSSCGAGSPNPAVCARCYRALGCGYPFCGWHEWCSLHDAPHPQHGVDCDECGECGAWVEEGEDCDECGPRIVERACPCCSEQHSGPTDWCDADDDTPVDAALAIISGLPSGAVVPSPMVIRRPAGNCHSDGMDWIVPGPDESGSQVRVRRNFVMSALACNWRIERAASGGFLWVETTEPVTRTARRRRVTHIEWSHSREHFGVRNNEGRIVTPYDAPEDRLKTWRRIQWRLENASGGGWEWVEVGAPFDTLPSFNSPEAERVEIVMPRARRRPRTTTAGTVAGTEYTVTTTSESAF